MPTIDIMPPPDLKPLLNPPSKFEREQAAFRRLLPKLLEQHRNQYVAIHDGQVVGSGDELVRVALAAYDRFGYQAIYVDLVTDEPVRPARIPHFKPL
jgi:Family of unknown function (DUF5678)